MFLKRMQKSLRKSLSLATGLSVVLLLSGQVARAQSWSYGWGLGSSLLYPLTYLPYRLLYGGGYGYGNSGYALNNLMYQGAYAPYGYVPYGGKFGFGNSQNQQNQPYSNSGQFNYGQPNVNSQGQQPAYNNSGNGTDPGYFQPQYQDPSQSYQPQAQSGKHKSRKAPAQTSTQNQSFTSPSTVNSSTTAFENAPPVAPERIGKNSPFVDGFIQQVLTKFNGDIGQALNDKEMYSWAQALDLVERKKHHTVDLTDSRKATIETVLKDDSLDSRAKLETLRILLK